MQLEDSIEVIKSIGEQRASKFHKLGIYTVNDMIEYFPRDYTDRSQILSIEKLEPEKENTFIAKVSGTPETMRFSGRIITKIKFSDETGIISAVWYNQPYLKSSFSVGEEYLITGKVVRKYGKLEVSAPEYEKMDDKELLSGGRIVPIYASTYKLSQKMIRQFIKSMIDDTYNQLDEFLPIWLRKQWNIADRNFSIQNIHFPSTEENFFIARRRLVFEELFLLQLGLMKIKLMNNESKAGCIIPKSEEQDIILKELPFELTNAQKTAIAEIQKDFESGYTMNRLIQGDVGSGKTMVALIAAVNAVKAGYQVAMMVPTEVLAQQHFETFNKLLGCIGIKSILLLGSMTKKQKKEAYEHIELKLSDIILGTHALIQENVIYNNLGLVITDEQHRFGVKQRAMLANKGDNPHTLVMTATPIPRTLAMILYGDLDITVIDELPPGRQKIDTFCVNESYRSRVYEFIRKQVQQGRQVYIVCPMVEESENQELKAVTEYAQSLKQEVFQELEIEYVYGKMKPIAKQDIMNRFAHGQINILISTTVIEVGINVPNATLMVIENADRFGLAQLHQLRGRVGRGEYKSYCILITESKNKVTQERMKIMQRSNDGFELSEVDLGLRGPGDFFGTRQHGLPELKIANLYKDMDILKEVQQAAKLLLESDRELMKEENLSLKIKLKKFFEGDNNLSIL